LHGEIVEIERHMDKPSKLVSSEEYVEDLKPIPELTSRVQYVLIDVING